MIFCIFALQTINYVTKPTVLKNCYLPNCTIRLTKENSSVCVDLESANNTQCDVLQDGINVTINLIIEGNNSSGQQTATKKTIYGFYYGFNYSETKTICIDSDNPSGAASDFYLASGSQVILNSIAYTNTFAPGLIQRISGDNSQFLNETTSIVYFNKSEICAYTDVISTYIKNFNTSNIINATLVISEYFGSGKRENISIIFTPNNTTSGITLTYDGAKHNFTFCYAVNGLNIYPYLDTSISNGYLYIYYQIDQFTNQTASGSNNSKMMVYFEAKIVNYDFSSVKQVFKEINIVIMESEVAIQSIMSSDPSLLQAAKNYTAELQKYPNNQGMRLSYIYCQNDPALFGSVYNSHKVGYSNVSQLLNENLFAPNKSVQSNIDKLQQFVREPEGCIPQFKYQMFAFNGRDLIQSYSQQGNLAFYSCFTQVKFSSTGDFQFVRNDLPCTRLNKSQTVYFEILDINTRKSIFQYQVDSFSINDLTYKIPLNITINSVNNTLQILNTQKQMIDMIVFFSVTEVNQAVVVEKQINVGIFSAIQIVFTAMFIVLRKTLIPKIQEKIKQKKQLLSKMKTEMMDL